MSEIDELRSKMDKVTLEMIQLLKSRTDIARQIGKIKQDTGRSITDQKREENLRQKVSELCQKIELDEGAASKLLSYLLNDSIRVQSPQTQTHLSIFHRAKELEAQGKEIIHMEVGEPDFAPPIDVKKAMHDAYDKGYTRYGNPKGRDELRSKLAEYASLKFGCTINKENITVTPGARFAVFCAMSTLLDPGDEVIVIDPSWPAYKECAMSIGAKVKTIKTQLRNAWDPNTSEIKESIHSNTKMIILNYPNNPTGMTIAPFHLDTIMNIAQEKNLYVLSDEIYSEYAPDHWKSTLQYKYKNSITIQSFSKSHAMTGFRIGYAMADESIINKMARLQALCLTSVAEPIQYAAMQALDSDISENPKKIRARQEILSEEAQRLGLEHAVPNGAMYLWAMVRGKDGTKIAEQLLEHGLAVAPGEGFGEYKEYIRISACADENKLKRGMNILGKVLG